MKFDMLDIFGNFQYAEAITYDVILNMCILKIAETEFFSLLNK